MSQTYLIGSAGWLLFLCRANPHSGHLYQYYSGFFPRILSQNHPFKRYHVYQSCHQGQLSHVKSFPVNHNLSDFSLPISLGWGNIYRKTPMFLGENQPVSGEDFPFNQSSDHDFITTCQLAASCRPGRFGLRHSSVRQQTNGTSNQCMWDIYIYNIYIIYRDVKTCSLLYIYIYMHTLMYLFNFVHISYRIWSCVCIAKTYSVCTFSGQDGYVRRPAGGLEP